jgi:hypothetical protein
MKGHEADVDDGALVWIVSVFSAGGHAAPIAPIATHTSRAAPAKRAKRGEGTFRTTTTATRVAFLIKIIRQFSAAGL